MYVRNKGKDMENEIGVGVEIDILHEENFLKIKETLTRIGISSRKDKKLYQSCHILHKRGKYYIVHFKEMFILDGIEETIPTEDVLRRNTISNLLEDWGLCEIVNFDQTEDEADMRGIKIIPFREKGEWQLVPKYNIGK
jgi:hypothetical protein